MSSNRDEITAIKNLLKGNPQGMTVTKIAGAIDMSRNSVAKYLEMMLVSGDAEMRTFGPSKVYYLAQRLPITALFSLTSDLIVVLDGDLIIRNVNEPFLKLVGRDEKDLLNQPVEGSGFPILSDRELIGHLRDALDGKGFVQEICACKRSKVLYYNARIVPAVYGDGRRSVTLVMEDITDRKRMEEDLKAARDSLASRVLEQTRELTEMNAALKQEVAERRLIEEALRMDEARLEALLTLNEMESAPVERLAEYALERAVEQTGSRIGYILTPDERARKARVFTVSREAQRLSRLDAATEFDLDRDILCLEPFHTRRPAIENDYASRPGKSCLPEGHVPLRRTLGVPVLDGGRVAAVALVGNKESDYTQADVRQLSLIMNGLWKAVLQRRAADALAESEAKFRYTFDQSPMGAAIVSLDSRFQRVNPELCRLTGYSSDELLDMRFLDITHKDDRQSSAENVRALQAGTVDQFEMEKRYVRRDGRIVYARTLVRLVKDAAGRPLYFLPLIQDITEWKRAEEALSRTQRFQETLISNLPGMVYRCRNDAEWTMEYVSDVCVELTGYTPADLVLNRTIAYNDLIHPDDRARVREEIREALAKDGPFKLTYRIRTADGREKWVWEQGRRAPGEKPDDIAIEGFITDITERRKAEEALRESEVRFRSLIYNSSDIVRIIDRDGLITFDSPSSTKLLGYPSGYTLGKSTLDFIHPDDRERVKRDLGQVYSMINPGIPTEFRIRKASGEYLEVESVGMNMVGVPGVDGIVINTRPITERKRNERALQESRAWLDSIFRSAPTGIGIVVDRIIRDANDRLCEMTGYTREELVGKSSRVLYPSDGDYEHVGRVKYDQIQQAGTGSVETRWQRKDGRIIDIFLSSTPLDRNDLRAGVTFTALDITERKSALHALSESEALFRSFIEQSFDGIALTDSDGNVIEFNRRMEEITGLKRADLLGRPTWDVQIGLLPPEERTPQRRKEIEDTIRQALATHDSPVFYRYTEGRITRPDGQQRVIQYMLFPMEFSGRFMIGSVNRDVTGQRVPEQR